LLDHITYVIQEHITHTTINTDSKNYDVNEQKEKERLIVLNETLKNNKYKISVINAINICIGVTMCVIALYNVYNKYKN